MNEYGTASIVARERVLIRRATMEPLHVVQAELLRRDRESPQQPLVERALMASIAGIAAGMRNTG